MSMEPLTDPLAGTDVAAAVAPALEGIHVLTIGLCAAEAARSLAAVVARARGEVAEQPSARRAHACNGP